MRKFIVSELELPDTHSMAALSSMDQRNQQVPGKYWVDILQLPS